MLRFFNFAKFLKTESVIIRQPSVLARDFSSTNWLDQANGKGKKGSRKDKGSKISSGGGGSKSKSKSSSGSLGKSSKLFGSKASSGGIRTSVHHDKRANKFTLDLGNNQSAHIDYRPLGHNKIELYYTEVPNELRGRGIGKALAKGALEEACRNKLKVKLSCTYLINNLDKFADSKLKKILES